MDAVHESEQPLDIGVCKEHSRVFECYCNICFVMICPSCLMFGEHVGHQVSKIEDGARSVRNKINHSAKEGLLKFQMTENVLLDIRHVKLTLQQNQQKILAETEDTFDQLILTLKNRKNVVIEDIKKHFTDQLNIVQQAESNWLQKQQISQKIVELQGSTDDIKLIQQARFIIQGLQRLSQPMAHKVIYLIEDVKNNIAIGKYSFSYKQFKDSLKDFVQKGTAIANQLKC